MTVSWQPDKQINKSIVHLRYSPSPYHGWTLQHSFSLWNPLERGQRVQDGLVQHLQPRED